MRVLVLVLVMLAGVTGLVGPAGIARADEPPLVEPTSPSSPAATPSDAPAPAQTQTPAAEGDDTPPQALIDPDSEVSRRNYDQGIDLYEKGDYAGAIKVFEAANFARSSPALVFDIARCYDRMGDWHQALRAYQRFWSVAPPAQRTAEVEQRIATLEDRLYKERLPFEIARRKRWRIAAIAVGAVAVASLVAGGSLYGWAKADLPSREAYCKTLPRECVPGEWSDLSARANASYALFAIGAVAAAADVGLWVVSTIDRSHAHAWLAPTGNGVALGATF